MLQPGTKIGRYEIQRKLARGGMGTVYVAHDPVLGRMVAVKVFVGDLEVPDAAERFSREARAAASLNHTNIVTIYDFGEVESQPYIVMEYIQGETITEIIRRRTPVPVVEKLRWLEELCAGAASAHRMDVIHRDLKPSNLMIDRNGRVKILDFGIAKIINSLGNSKTAVIGTPGYMAPEQLLGHSVDARTDIFAIGVVCFELLTYEEAFQGDSFTAVTHRIINENVRPVSDVVPDVPPDLCDIVEKSLQKSPADRYRDAESLRIALSRVRRRLEQSSDLDASSAQTIVSPMGAPVRKFGTGTSRKAVPSGARTAELTPPPDPATALDAQARARTAKMGGALQRSEACLQNGEFARALEACKEVFTIEPAHAGALALERTITAAMARQRAATLIGDARVELGRGALTRCKTLLDEARHLDPAAHDATLERELRLARVEEERKRHRIETTNQTIATARSAFERGDVEAALACAREALSLDPNSAEAREIELSALRALDALDDSRPTLSAAGHGALDEETTVISITPPVAERATTGAAPPAATNEETTVDTRPHMADDETTVVPLPQRHGHGGATAFGDRPTPLPPPLPTMPVPAVPPPRAAADARPVPMSSGVPAPVPRAVPPAAPLPSPKGRPVSAVATLRDRIAALPLQQWREAVGSAGSQVLAKMRAVPRRQWMVLVAIVGVVLVAILVAALLARRSSALPPTGLVVIEAVPWASVTAIKGADGRNRLTTASATPLSMVLPTGTYSVELTGPAGSSEQRTLTIQVEANGMTVTPAARFHSLTSDEYFSQYVGGEAPAVPGSPSSGTTP